VSCLTLQVDMGVAHGDDLQYIFSDLWGEELTMSASDTKFTRNVMAPLLTNFAKTSVPTPQVSKSLNNTTKKGFNINFTTNITCLNLN